MCLGSTANFWDIISGAVARMRCEDGLVQIIYASSEKNENEDPRPERHPDMVHRITYRGMTAINLQLNCFWKDKSELPKTI